MNVRCYSFSLLSIKPSNELPRLGCSCGVTIALLIGMMQRAIHILARQLGWLEHDLLRTATAVGQLTALPTQLKDLQRQPTSSYATLAAGPANNPATLRVKAKSMQDIQLELQQASGLKSVNDRLLAFETLPAVLVEAALSRVEQIQPTTDQHPRLATKLAHVLQNNLSLLLHTYTGQQLASCLVSIAAGIPRDLQQPKLISRILAILLDRDGELLNSGDSTAAAQVVCALHKLQHEDSNSWEQLCKHLSATRNDWSKDPDLSEKVGEAFSWVANHYATSTTLQEAVAKLAA